MQGHRADPEIDPVHWTPGEYGPWENQWYALTPTGILANISGHRITEFDDGTISVEPSILVQRGHGPERWHGYLRNGIWSEC